MPTWLVKFEKPVIYRPTHPKPFRRVMVTELPVYAPDAEGAKIHALRMTAGDGGTIVVTMKKAGLQPDPVPQPVGEVSYVAPARADGGAGS